MENIRSFLGLKTKSSARKHRTRKHKTRKHRTRKSMRRGGSVPAGFHRMPDGTIMSDADHKGGMSYSAMGGKAHAMPMGGKSVGGNVLAEAVVPFGLYGVQKMLQRRSKKSKKDSKYTRSLKRAYFL